MVLAQANGWEKVAKAKWTVRERPDWRRVKPDYKLAALRARARIVALLTVDVLLNVVINNALHEDLQEAA